MRIRKGSKGESGETVDGPRTSAVRYSKRGCGRNNDLLLSPSLTVISLTIRHLIFKIQNKADERKQPGAPTVDTWKGPEGDA
jgi:hypothetical protein